MSDTREIAQACHYWSDATRRRITSLADAFESQRKNPSLDMQKLVTAEVAAIDAARSAVMTFCNAQLPINKLPLEVLTRIFYFCTLSDPPPSSPEATIQAMEHLESRAWLFRPRWLDLTDVCRLWRDIASNCPALWASRVTNQFGLQYMRKMLEFSKRAPLSLFICLDKWVTDECQRLMGEYISHVRAIHFTGNDPRTSASTHVLDLFTSPAPMLEELSVEPSPSLHCDNRLLVLSDDIFSTQAPKLRRLFLIDHFPPLSVPASPILIGVEHLDISVFPTQRLKLHPKFDRYFVNSQHAVPYFKLLNVLQYMKALKTLTLKRCLPPRIGSAAAIQHTLEFPQLKSLDIEDGANECIYFLQCLRTIPATAALSISCILAKTTLKLACSALAPLLRTHLNAAPTPIHALAVTMPDLHRQTTFALSTWRTPRGHASRVPELALQLDIQHRTKDDVADATRFLHDLPLASARAADFTLRGEFSWNTTRAAAVLRCAPAVEELWTIGVGGTAAIAALCPPAIELPALQVLGLVGLDLSAPGLTRDAQTAWMHSEQNYSRLQAFLKARTEAQGHALKLIIHKCTLEKPWMEKLSELVDVEWEGSTQIPGSKIVV